MSEYLDEIENQYELAETEKYFNVGVVNKSQVNPNENPDQEKEGVGGTILRSGAVGTVKMMQEVPENLARIVGLGVDGTAALLNKVGFNIQDPVFGSKMLVDGIQSIKNIGDELIPSSLNSL